MDIRVLGSVLREQSKIKVLDSVNINLLKKYRSNGATSQANFRVYSSYS